MSNPFAGVGDADRSGTKRNAFFAPGKYLVEVVKFVTFVGAKGTKNYGQSLALAEFKVIEVLESVEDEEGEVVSNTEGQDLVTINVLGRLPNGELSEIGGYAMSRVKSFVAAAMGNVDDEDIDADTVYSLTQAGKLEYEGETIEYGEGEALKGTRLVATGKMNKKGTFCNIYWDYAGNAE